MLRTLFLAAALSLFTQQSYAQSCPPGSGAQLRAGIPDWAGGSPLQVSDHLCETSESDIFLEVTDEEGSWFTPWIQVSVEAEPGNLVQEALVQQLITLHPWLAPVTPWQYEGKTSHFPPMTLHELAQLALALPDDDLVKQSYHPILDLDPGSTTETIHFNTAIGNWPHWPLLQGPPVYHTGDFWSPALVDAHDTDFGSRLFNCNSLMFMGLKMQGGADFEALIDSGIYSQAISEGVFRVRIQAISWRSPSPNHMTTPSPITTGGLTGYANGVFPVIKITNEVTIRLTPQLPLGGGPPGGGGPGYIFRPNSWNLLRVRNAYFPLTIQVTSPGGMSHTLTSEAPGVVPGAISVPMRMGRRPGVVAFWLPENTLPSDLTGPIVVTTPAGSTNDPTLPPVSTSAMQLLEIVPAELIP